MGDRVEGLVARMHTDLGIPCRRIPLSGSAGGDFGGDLKLEVIPGETWTGEVKARANGFASLEMWLAGADVAFLKPDRRPPLVAMAWATWAKVLQALSTRRRQ